MRPAKTPERIVAPTDGATCNCDQSTALSRQVADLESGIRKLAESLDLGSGSPYLTGADERVLKHTAERLLKLLEVTGG